MAILRRLAVIVPAALVAAGLMPRTAGAQSLGGSLEYQVKAAYLLNFTRYVSWPEPAFDSPTAPIHICVLGRTDPFGGALDQAVAGRASRGRPVLVERKSTVAEARYCPVVFVSRDAWRLFPGVIEGLRGHGVLTVGESEEFARRGGIIAFVIRDDHVRFVVNLEARDRAGLEISSRMLALAANLFDGNGGRP